jgi:hypothetical protein
MTTIDIVPEANFGIKICRNGTPRRNAVFLCTETDYMLSLQTTTLPYPGQLFRFMNSKNMAAIIRE